MISSLFGSGEKNNKYNLIAEEKNTVNFLFCRFRVRGAVSEIESSEKLVVNDIGATCISLALN